jgi:hypothetical protein
MLGGLPTLQEEVDRKAADTMSWLALSLDRGQITEDQFSVAVDAVNRAVCGLVGKWFIELVTASQELCPTDKSSVTKVYHFGARFASLRWVVGSDVVNVAIYDDGKLKSDTPKEFSSSKEACGFFTKAGETFVNGGWVAL